MGFDLLSFLSSLLGGIDVGSLEARGQTWLEEHVADYPDLDTAKEALSAFLTAELQAAKPELDAAKIKDTIYGVASDIIRGSAGVDPKASHGMV